MDPRLQRRVQRYGWDLAAGDYELLWAEQLAPAQDALLRRAALAPGERVLDVACGTGLVTLAAARAVGRRGQALGVDLSERMVESARTRALASGIDHATFARMDAERLDLPDGGLDVALCALGLMYLPAPEAALREMRRVLRPGGRLVVVVWGERAHCGWAPLFEIVDAEVESEVCPLFFRLGPADMLARLVSDAGFGSIRQQRIGTTLDYADGDAACRAAFAGGPVALAWSRFGAETRARVNRRYLASLEPWRRGERYRVPAEFVLVAATVPHPALNTRA